MGNSVEPDLVRQPFQRARGGLATVDVRAALDRFLAPLLLWSFPLFLTWIAVMPWHPVYGYAWDFHAFYDAGANYLHLRSPYASSSWASLTSEQNFVYPLPIAALFAPLALLPYPVAAVLFIATSVALLALALRMLGVRDWRCYAAVFLSLPVQFGIKLGTISPLLAFLLAVLWRYRDRPRVAGPALALLVVSKLFLWPVALLFLFSRRLRTFGLAVGLSLAAVLAATAPLGWRTLLDYPGLLSAVSHFEAPQSFSALALGMTLGLSSAQATAAVVAVGALVLRAAYRSRRDDSRTFRLLVAGALILSPLVWGHYLVVLVVPLALVRPRFSPLWFAGAWVIYDGFVLGRLAFAILTAAVLAVILLQSGIVDDLRAADRLRIPRGLRLRSGEPMIGLWIPFLVAAASFGSSVVTVAALRPASAHAASDGTAIVRLMQDERSVCWRLWTNGIPGAEVELVDLSRGAAVARGSLARSRGGACVPVRRSVGSRLVKAFSERSGGFELVVRGPTGTRLLQGPLLRRVDAGGSSR